MRISTLSVVVGSSACNARCPFCVSHMTPQAGVALKPPAVNWRNFKKACRLAQLAGTTTVMLTGKGEPTLFPDRIAEYLAALGSYDFPLIELQTNGIVIGDRATGSVQPDRSERSEWDARLSEWYALGLTTIALSVVHQDAEANRRIYAPHRKDYPDLARTVRILHRHGFSVRLTVTMLKGHVDSPEAVLGLAEFARANGVAQLTVRPVARPAESRDPVAAKWVDEHAVPNAALEGISRALEAEGTPLMDLPHGARVYDVRGQNVCLTDCLVVKPDAAELRNLIFFPDGALRYAWQHDGARLL